MKVPQECGMRAIDAYYWGRFDCFVCQDSLSILIKLLPSMITWYIRSLNWYTSKLINCKRLKVKASLLRPRRPMHGKPAERQRNDGGRRRWMPRPVGSNLHQIHIHIQSRLPDYLRLPSIYTDWISPLGPLYFHEGQNKWMWNGREIQKLSIESPFRLVSTVKLTGLCNWLIFYPVWQVK